MVCKLCHHQHFLSVRSGTRNSFVFFILPLFPTHCSDCCGVGAHEFLAMVHTQEVSSQKDILNTTHRYCAQSSATMSKPPGKTSNWPLYSPMEFKNETFGAQGYVPQSGDRQTNTPARMQPQGYRSPSTQGSGGLSRQEPEGRTSAVPTQLAERTPQLDTAQRVEPPSEMRAPKRRAAATYNEELNELFNPDAIQRPLEKTKDKYNIASYGDSGRASPTDLAKAEAKKKTKPRDKGLSENFSEMKTAIRDLELRAAACRRGERTRREGMAYFSMGVLYDNMSNTTSAISCYKKFIGCCQQTNDVVGAALAFNCIGYNYILLGKEAMKRGDEDKANAYLDRAAEFHRQHLQIADERGQFVAHCNLGIAYDRLKKLDAAARHHQDALRLSIHLQSTHGQCISVGNLGLVGLRQGDYATATACLDQHLQLVRSLRDRSAESLACHYLGVLANAQGEYAQATRYFSESQRLAKRTGEKAIMKVAACNIGMANANLKLNAHLQGVVERAKIGL